MIMINELLINMLRARHDLIHTVDRGASAASAGGNTAAGPRPVEIESYYADDIVAEEDH